MATKKSIVEKKTEPAEVFGYTDIKSNTISCLRNDFHHEDELRRELQGKPISVMSVMAAMKKVDFGKGVECGVHSFFPDAGKCFVGRSIGGHVYASVVISWAVNDPKVKAIEKLTVVLEKILLKG